MRVLLFIILFGSLLADEPLQKDWHGVRPLARQSVSNEEEGPRLLMTGDWNGAREAARDWGLDIAGSYSNDLLGNPVGGKHHGFANAGSFGLFLTFDLEKIMKATGTTFFASFIVRHGNNLSATKIGNQFEVAQLYGTETYVLNELYLKKTAYEGKISAKAGRLDPGNDFLASPLYAYYVNNAFFGNPVSIYFNTDFSTLPNATWGAYLQFRPIPSFNMQFACYNQNKNIFKNKYHGANFTFDSRLGVMWITEWAYLLNQGKEDTGLPGNYRVGGYYVTGRFDVFEGGTQRGNFGYYFLIDQMVYRHKTQQLTPFGAFLFAPNNRNEFPFFFAAGLVYKGFIPSRKDDAIAIGAAYGRYSSDLRHLEQQAKRQGFMTPHGNQPQTAETILELNYWIQATHWLTITPDVQYVIDPKGLGTIQDALVLGVEIEILL